MIHILILIAAYGICFSLQHKITFLHNRIGIYDKMIKCTFCTGFHCGWIAYLLSKCDKIREIEFSSLILFAFASAAFCYAVDEVMKFIERFGDNE